MTAGVVASVPLIRSEQRLTYALLLGWLASGLFLSLAPGHPVVMRTQEARVLETAREMIGAPFEQWMFPKANGQDRLQKPPLAYWLTAGSFKAFGIGEVQGRIPAITASWATVGLTMLIARRLFSERVAMLACVAMIGSVLFLRHSRFGETDILVMAFVTAAIVCLWYAFGVDDDTSPSPINPPRDALFFHLAAIAMALAVLTKGPAAVFPLAFFIPMCAIERRWRPLRRFFTSGAPLTFALLAAPWFIYVSMRPASEALYGDLETSMMRKGWKLPTAYVLPMLLATLPWTTMFLLACVNAVRAWRTDARVRGVLVWAGAIAVPLCLWGNKQRHYLLPLIPPMMMLIGWQIDTMIRSQQAGRGAFTVRGSRVAWQVTLIGYALAAVAAPVAGIVTDGWLDPIDMLMTLLIAAVIGVTLVINQRHGFGPAITTLAMGNLAAVFVGLAFWSTTFQPINNRTVADAIATRYGNVPLAFVGREHMPLCWQLHRIIPPVKNEAELAKLAAARPGLVAIEVLEKGAKPMTPMLVEQMRFDDGDDKVFIAGPVDVRALTAR